MPEILVNKIVTPDGTVLVSRYRHDYVTHLDANGEEYMRDGGNDYIRCNLNKEPATDCTCTTDDPIEKTREHFSWGSYGKHGDESLHYIVLKDMKTEHIEAILEHISMLPRFVKMFNDELVHRRDNG